MVRDSTKIAVLSYARAGKCLSGLCGATVLTKPLSHYVVKPDKPLSHKIHVKVSLIVHIKTGHILKLVKPWVRHFEI